MSYTEHVTRVLAEDLTHERLGTVAVIRFAPEKDGSSRPATMGPQGITRIVGAIREAIERAEKREVDAIALTGTDRIFLAGADLSIFEDPHAAQAHIQQMTRLVHELQVDVRSCPVPVLAHINGTALGGGLETALLADYRTAAPGARGIGLPETSLGILPGWGGTTLLPGLVGPAAAVRLVIQDPAKDKQLSAREAEALGLVHKQAATFEDALEAFADAAEELRAQITGPGRPNPIPDAGSPAADQLRSVFDTPFSAAETIRQYAVRQADAGATSALRVMQHYEQLPGSDLADALEREGRLLLDLALQPAAAASIYAAGLLRSGKPGREPIDGARELRRVGVAGAGLMAAQIAAQLALGLQVPVIMRDLNEEITDKGVETARGIVKNAAERGQIEKADAKQIAEGITGTTLVHDLKDADLVIEAVTEVMRVKQSVFAELEGVLAEDAVLATNTSSLSVAEMAEGLTHPERVVGIHFFNPVAKMPLVEVVHTKDSSKEAIATAREAVRRLRKFGVESLDRPGFIVNRLLFRVLPEVLRSVDHGADPETANASLDEIGLPMRPFTLLDMVGHGVAKHVGETFVRELSADRFYDSAGLAAMMERGAAYTVRDRSAVHPGITDDVAETAEGLGIEGDAPVGEELLQRVQDGLAEEIGLMLEEKVVKDVSQIDLALILGAGFPRHRGGITPYLDATGASERVLGTPFHGNRFTR